MAFIEKAELVHQDPTNNVVVIGIRWFHVSPNTQDLFLRLKFHQPVHCFSRTLILKFAMQCRSEENSQLC